MTDSSSTPVASGLGPITRALRGMAFDRGEALQALVPLVHQDLKRIARAQRARMRPGETLCTTALVNEAYLKLVRSGELNVESRKHFFALASLAMRQILVDYARGKSSAKREHLEGGVIGEDIDPAEVQQADMVLELDEALERLEQLSPRLAHIVNCRYFGGYSEQETAEILGITDRTVRRDWVKAKAWLAVNLAADETRS